MTHPAHGWLRRSLGVVAVLACFAASPAGSPAVGPPRSQSLLVLQLNLCNSGMASCYTGRSVAEAAAVIRAERPDVVMLNEVCEDDLDELAEALAQVRSGGTVMAFQAAFSRRTGEAVRCRNGQQFGIGLLVQLQGKDNGRLRYGALYPVQSLGEQRVWLCLHAPAAFYACTTHLASDAGDVAMAQCQYLLSTAIPTMRASGEWLPAVVGGDFNLGTADAVACLPSDYTRVDDGGVQQIMAEAGFVIDSSRMIDMHGATDHPGLLVVLNVQWR